MARLICYCRVSSENQQNNTSLTEQRKRIEAYCTATGHDIVSSIEETETASGEVARPGFDAALASIYSGAADGIICTRIDRFARSTSQGLKIAGELRKRDKQLVVLDSNLDTSTPTGRCVFAILLSFAQLERRTINERCASGRAAVAAANGYVGGRPPYGWRTSGKRLYPLPEEQKVRRLILRWHGEGMSLYRIANELNRHGVPTTKGGKWFMQSVKRVIDFARNGYRLAHLMEGGNEKAR